jgi:hypothetical protein
MLTIVLMTCLIYPAVLLAAMFALEFGNEPRWRDDQ